VVFSWLPSLERQHPTDVEVRFESADGGTRVELEHSGWERVAEEAPDLRDSYEGGWDMVLGRYASATG
ncbi:MAG TPA: SRPBCC domain-containing protein, partial [Actinomycetota bacterium]|nr:SRPBCC domain-containing protein [Actinomycetota bacterium]